MSGSNKKHLSHIVTVLSPNTFSTGLLNQDIYHVRCLCARLSNEPTAFISKDRRVSLK